LVERLDTSCHQRDGFCCGNEALDTYLTEQANQSQSRDCAITYVLIEDPGDNRVNPCQVVGYITLISQSIPLAECPAWVAKKITNKPLLPAILVARMAVDNKFKGRKLGEALLVKVALRVAKEQADSIGGCAIVFLDAKDDVAKSFYLRYGFMELPKNPFQLFMPMSEIRKLFSN